ncbi:MAG: hypothetical protein KDA94_17395 [Acidimicrobiales bacterium]|nr:hypothetical protein [Acidimicrobiales bacterium]
MVTPKSPRRFTSFTLLLCGLLSALGCQPTSEESTSETSSAQTPVTISTVPLRISIAGDDELASTLQTGWRGFSEQPLEIKAVAAGELIEAAPQSDIIIAPSMRLGDLLAAEAITPLPAAFLSQPSVNQAGLLAGLVNDAMKWENEMYGLPLGSRIPALWVAPDVNIEDVSTWQGYSQALANLPVGEAAEPLAEGWAAYAFLHRVSTQTAGIWLFDRQSLEPKLTDPPYVRALQQLVADRSRYPDELLTPHQVWSKLASGELKVAIGWPTALPQADADSRARLASLRMEPTPRGSEVFVDDWQAAKSAPINPTLPPQALVALVGAKCRQTAVARSFLAWLASPEGRSSLRATADQFAAIRPKTSSAAGDDDSPVLEAVDPLRERYDQLVITALSSGEVRPSLRIPASDQYMSALDAAIRTALTGEKTPEQALQDASTAWEAITEELGRRTQLRSWRQAQGMRGR